MARFFLGILLRLPYAMWESVRHTEGFIAIVFFVALLVNEPVGKKLMNWEGISPLWSLIPIGSLFALSLMKAIYVPFAILEVERDSLLRELGRTVSPHRPIRIPAWALAALAGALIAAGLLVLGVWIGRDFLATPQGHYELRIVPDGEQPQQTREPNMGH